MEEDPGRLGYEAYAKVINPNWPTWDQLGEQMQNAWRAAADAISEHVLDQLIDRNLDE